MSPAMVSGCGATRGKMEEDRGRARKKGQGTCGGSLSTTQVILEGVGGVRSWLRGAVDGPQGTGD